MTLSTTWFIVHFTADCTLTSHHHIGYSSKQTIASEANQGEARPDSIILLITIVSTAEGGGIVAIISNKISQQMLSTRCDISVL